MYHTIDEFMNEWIREAKSTEKVLDNLTDESLSLKATPEYRTLGSLAWHVVTSLHEMLSRTGLTFTGAEHDSSVPVNAKEIADSYRTSSENMIAAIKEQWTDKSLSEMDDMYGDQWPKSLTLSIVNSHQIHHRGQLTVLMRLAGLRVPGMYGPSREEWEEFGMETPSN
ncbi:DinB family protein [Cytobacillus sp. FJAT-53684]|uniref:DinB family protein n=1 Tax=Cytobacillus mangrovibacter TaxID=3299024 RepID=A0ABW6JSN9_9BACI